MEHDGAALRRPAGLRLRRPLRAARARRRAAGRRSPRVWTGDDRLGPPADLNAGGSKFCGDCPLKLPLKKDQTAAAARPERCRRCPRGCTSRPPPPATSRASRPAAPRRPASRAPVRPACSTSSCSSGSSTRPGPSLGPHRLLQLRRGVPAQARRGDVRIHQAAVPAHLSLHEHERPRLQRGAGPPAGPLGHRRGDVLDRRRHRRRATSSTGAAATSTRRSGTCASRRTRSAPAGRDVPFINWRYILFTHNDSDAGDAAGAGDGRRDRRRSAVLGADRSSRGPVLAAVPAGHRRTSRASATRSGTTTISATPSPAPRRAPRSTCAARCRWPGCRSSRGTAGR